jgi:hypothetical protein
LLPPGALPFPSMFFARGAAKGIAIPVLAARLISTTVTR